MRSRPINQPFAPVYKTYVYIINQYTILAQQLINRQILSEGFVPVKLAL